MTFAKKSALALGLGATLMGGAWAAPSDRHDGTWSVQMVTDSGLCDRTYGYSIAIENGNVRYLLASGDSPTTVSGRSPRWRRRPRYPPQHRQGRCHRQPRRQIGLGLWKLGMLGCTGRWTAQKRSSVARS